MKSSKQRPRSKNVSDEESQEETPLHLAALEGNIEELRDLLRQNNYDVNAFGDRKFTALHFAANSGHLEACKLLLCAGADPNLKTASGDTALHLLSSHSFENESAYHSTVDMMLKQSCSMFSRGDDSQKPKRKRSNTMTVLSKSQNEESVITTDDSEEDSMQLNISDSSSYEYETPKREDTDEKRRKERTKRDPADIQLLSSPRNSMSPRSTLEFSDSDSGNQSTSSDQDSESKRPKISYPPSPLSTEFETTESSEVGIEHYTIVNQDNESEQEQAISSSMKEFLLDAIHLRTLRSKNKSSKSFVPSVLRRDSPQLSHRSIITNSPLIKGRYKRSFSTDISSSSPGHSPTKSNLPSRQSIGRLIRNLLDPSLASKDPFFVIDFLKIHRFFMTPQDLLKNMILRYTFNTDESVPQKVNCSILKTRTRILEVMVCWVKGQFTDFWMHPDVVDTANQFVNEISASDDPPETLPISEIMELKEILDDLCDNFQPPELPRKYVMHLLSEETCSFGDILPAELAEEITLMLASKLRQITPMDFALFHQNENIILSCPRIVDYYETIDKLRRWISSAIILQSSRKKRAQVIEYFILLADRCLLLRNYQGAQVVLQSLTSESIGRLNETWGQVSSSKISIIQNVMNILSKNIDFAFCCEQLSSGISIVPDIEMVFQQYIDNCTSLARSKQLKINFKQARRVLNFNQYISKLSFALEERPHVRRLLDTLSPLPSELIQHFSRSHEHGSTGKPKTIQMTIHGLTCRITRGSLTVLNGKIEDLIDLLLDPNLAVLVRDITEELFLTHRYYISAADLCYLLLQRLEVPALTKYSLAEQAVIMKRHLIVREKVTELLQKWWSLHAAKLKKDSDMKRVVMDFSRKTTFLSPDETFFYITTLCNSYRKKHKPDSSVHRLKEGVDNFSLGGPAWADDIIYKQQFPKIASRQFCLLEAELFRKITAMDLLSYSAYPSKKNEWVEGTNRVELWSTRFNLVSNWVSTMIVKQTDIEKRVIVLKNFIKLGYNCLMLNNFNTSYAIFASLFSLSVSRLHNTWKEQSPNVIEKFKHLEFVFDTVGGHRNYQNALAEAKLPVIPWLGIYTKHIFSIREHNPDMTSDNRVNFEKFTSLVSIIRKVFEIQSVEYDFVRDPAAQQYLTDLKAMSDAEINTASKKLEVQHVKNPLFEKKLDLTSANKDGGGNKMLLRKGKRGELQTTLQKTTSFHFSKKTFVEEDGRKTIYVKNPIFQHPSLSKSIETSSGDEKEKSKGKKRGIRRFFVSTSSPV